MNKPISTAQKSNLDYMAMVEYFEPTIEYSKTNRANYSHLLNDGFSVSCWEPLCKKIAVSEEPFPKIIASITLQEPRPRTIGVLLELLSYIKKDNVSTYLYKQVKAHAAMDFHAYWKVLLHLGFGSGIRSSVWKKWSYPQSLLLIEEAIDRYWDEDDGAFKVKPYSGPLMTIKYKNISFDIRQSTNNEQSYMILRNFSSLKKFVEDIYSSKNTIAEIKQTHNALSGIFDRLFEVFNPDKVLNELEEQFEKLILENTPIISVHVAYYQAFGYDPSMARNKDIRRSLSLSILKEKYESLLKTKIEKQKNRRFSSNQNILKRRQASFSLVFLQQNLIRERSYEVQFNNLPIFTEWGEYMLSLEDRIRVVSIQASLSILNFVARCHSKTENFSTKDISQGDLIDFLNDESMSQQGASDAKVFLSNMIDFLMAKKSVIKLPLMGPLPEPPNVNICKNIKVKKPDQVSNRISIPEVVFTEIMSYIDELEPTHKNAFELIAAGGLRPNELEGILPGSLIEKDGKLVLCIWEYKKEKMKGRKGKKPIREIPLNFSEAIQAFREQVKISEDARKASGHDSIFIRRIHNSNVYGVLTTSSLKQAVNNLIKKHNIFNLNTGELWHYTPYQLRVSLIVEMIEYGASDAQLKAFFGWNADSTTENAYFMARKLKLMEMDTEFFKREFAVNLSQEAIGQYSEEELNEIVIMFYATSREMSYGRCMRHPSQGICGKLHEASACAPCENIKVSPHYRKKWEELYALQYRELLKLRLYYGQRGHTEEQYKKYEFYVVQSGILESYANILMNIDKPSVMKVVKWHE
ncbi:tyrosine-type recombinase/integrase [Sulfuricurvum sp.]|uniref:tyrosine-type recombinase/integrase n=1 Tax=Sulfuricurvum sp. TaxID=2025608 RepID=UPI002614DCB6|nr:tyrosine-type recombinase/integrase [Sulfuricurvum sp.]MDD2781781.1 tyrosine-type recombinase/integrase [Sulfuricurvum sp.]